MAEFIMSRMVHGIWEDAVDIEDKFQGLKVGKVSGLDNYGAAKNIYTESYPESEELRVYIPEKVTREAVDVEFEITFKGGDRRDTFHRFMEYIDGYKLKFHDTERRRECILLLTDSVEVTQEEFYGTSPFMTVSFKFKNIGGRTDRVIYSILLSDEQGSALVDKENVLEYKEKNTL